MCTAAGCDSILAIEFTEVDIEPDTTYTVDICVEDECVSETITIDVPHPGTGEIIRGETERHLGSPEGRMLVWADDDRMDFFLPDQEYGVTAQVSFSLTTSDGNVLAEVDSIESTPSDDEGPNGFMALDMARVDTRGPQIQPLDVLCIDDDASNLAALSALLQRWGHRALTAADPEAALLTLRRQRPDLLLVDLQLEAELDGFALISILCREAGGQLPAALVTAERGEAVLARARQLGLPVLNKPVQPAALRALVEAVAARRENARG